MPHWVPPGSWSADSPLQRFGQLVTTAPSYPVSARGFPRLQKEEAGRVDEQLAGTINAGTGALGRRYEIASAEAMPAAPMAGSGWAGMSGAAVFGGDLLLGVIRRDRQAAAGTWLAATRIRVVLAEPAARELIEAHCGTPLVLEPAELAGVLDPSVPVRDLRSPAMLLRAETEAVGFRGREHERPLLLRWCLDGGPGIAVRVLAGPGSQGKTRLARWLMAAVRERDWSAGELRVGIADDAPGPPPD